MPLVPNRIGLILQSLVGQTLSNMLPVCVFRTTASFEKKLQNYHPNFQVSNIMTISNYDTFSQTNLDFVLCEMSSP